MKNIFLTILLFTYTSIAFAQMPNSNQNYRMSEMPTVAIQQIGDIPNLTATQKAATISYFDGLGREIQKIDWAASNDKKDLIQAIEYDNIGRVSRDFLSYRSNSNTGEIQSNTFNAGQTFYYQMYGVTSPAYADRVFDGSPLNEVIEQGFAGTAWQVYDAQGNFLTNRHTTQKHLAVFDANIPIPKWKWTSPNYFSFSALYAAGELIIEETINENGHKSFSYKNKIGQNILTRTQVDNTTYASTLYLYNDLGQLDIVVQPQGYAALSANAWNLSSSIKKDFCFQYIYDAKGRIAAKKIPSSDWAYFVYDKLDRLVLSQDGNLAVQKDWLFTKYDIFSRPIMTGIFQNWQMLSQNNLQALMDGNTFTLYESPSTQTYGYTNTAFPNVGTTLHSITYYDNYDLDRNGTADDSYTTNTNFPNNSVYENATGKVTAVKTRILNPDPDMPDWLLTVSFYDKYGRVLQTRADNHLGGYDITTSEYDFTGKVLKTETLHEANEKLSPAGNLQLIKNVVKKEYSYDHRGRLLQVKQANNSENPIILLQNRYDALGKLIEKNVHSTDNGAHFLQSIDYRYNIRGWLTHINRINYAASRLFVAFPQEDEPNEFEEFSLRKVHITFSKEDSLQNKGIIERVFYLNLTDIPKTAYSENIATHINSVWGESLNEEQKDTLFQRIVRRLVTIGENEPEEEVEEEDLFREELRYDDPYTDLASGGSALYNGNIATQIWQTKAQGNRVRSYHYRYDAMSRLIGDLYWSYYNGAWGQVARYNTQNINYDLNGNILAMQRRGILTNNNFPFVAGNIDDLTYLYSGNRLQSVEDAVAVGTGVYLNDFQNKVSLPIEYLYDLNGNIVEDKNAGFDDILYNYLNKPTQIHETGTGNVLHIIYAADGTKLRQKGIEILDYSTGYLYRNGEMLYFAHEEGRCLRTATQQTGGSHPVLEPMFRYEYNLKDHLGNVRVSFTTGANGLPLVLQEQHYEAYGLELGGLTYRSGEENRYLYNGKERVDEFGLSWYDYGFRWLDAKIGRFVSVDPLAEKFYYLTTYQYASNSPIANVDLDGLEAYFAADGKFLKWGENKSATAPVMVNDKQISVNYKEFMDRVHWVYGDGGNADNFSVNDVQSKVTVCEDESASYDNSALYIAFAIENLKQGGSDGTGNTPYSEESLKIAHWKDDKHSYKANTIQTAGKLSLHAPYPVFNEARNKFENGETTAFNGENFRKNFAAVISVATGNLKDPTYGATGWVGGTGNGDDNITWNRKSSHSIPKTKLTATRIPTVKIPINNQTSGYKGFTVFYYYQYNQQ